MQSLWSRAAPSQSTCRCVSCLTTTANGVASRSATAASKRRLRIGNSVTALYTSIFAAAALADAKAKNQRRHDWDEKIAAVKAEVNELLDEEQRILISLQSRRKTRGLNRLLQARCFGTAEGPSSAINQPARPSSSTRSFHTERRLLNPAGAQGSVSLSREAENDLGAPEPADGELFATASEAIPSWVSEDTLRLKAVQKLALKQFAIRMLLRPTIAHRYSGISMNYASDHSLPRINVEKLLEELNSIRRRIYELKTYKDADFGDVIHDYDAMYLGKMQKGRDSLDAELDQDIQLFMSQQMSLEELLLRMSSNLLNSVDPDRTAAFRYMMMAFTRARQNDLNELLLRTLLPNQFYLSSSLIITILSFYRKSKNLKDFDLFLQMLGGEGYAVNLGSLGHYRQRKINGVDVIVPPLDSSNPVIYATLISAALRFDQPDRADAWLQAARSIGFFDDFSTLFCYLRFYSIRQDWEKGTHALKRAVTYLVSSTDHPRAQVERLLARMVHLCDSCNRLDVSETLISAAMHSGFDPGTPARQLDLTPIVDHGFERWTKAAETTSKESIKRPLWQKCYEFANIFGERLRELEVPENDSIARKYTKLAGQHAQDVMSSALTGGPAQFKRTNAHKNDPPKRLEPEDASTHDASMCAQKSQSEDITALKDEVAQLRELVFQLRKHHIQDSFKEEDSPDLEREEPNSQSTGNVPPTDIPNHQPSSMSVEFERVNNLIDSDEFHTLPSSPRKPGKTTSRRKRRGDLMTMAPPAPVASSWTATPSHVSATTTGPENAARTVPPAHAQAKGLHRNTERERLVSRSSAGETRDPIPSP